MAHRYSPMDRGGAAGLPNEESVMGIDRYAKAIVGALIAGCGTVGTALADGHITATEWLLAAITALTALGGVWATTNAPAK